MAAGKLDILIEQGATFTRVLTLKDSLNAAINLTGWTFRGQIRKRYDSAEILAPFSFVVADQNTDAGKVTMSLAPAVSSAIPVTKSTKPEKDIAIYPYDVEAETSGGIVYRILDGVASISPEVTR